LNFLLISPSVFFICGPFTGRVFYWQAS
jgi:hypothetical protein